MFSDPPVCDITVAVYVEICVSDKLKVGSIDGVVSGVHLDSGLCDYDEANDFMITAPSTEYSSINGRELLSKGGVIKHIQLQLLV